ncbi:MAG: phospho-N-acetylmuramoyl-pentapeptide-transferase, partial [Actinomycetales bacterium]|nr:phospho-N-acetylmuramoyl-pentapeptide-transferase [Actinomycetales bacterium]
FLAVWVTGAIVEISSLLVLFLMVGLGVVGFIDDFIKTHKQRSLGLGGISKVIGQVVVAVTFALLTISFPDETGQTPASMHISFLRNTSIDFMQLGLVAGIIVFSLWIVLIVTATSNAVNVTDGLDGLATGASIFAIGSFVIINFWQFNQSCYSLRLDPAVQYKCYEVRDPLDLAIVAAAIVGGLIGFLWWNTSPAQIFLGDTGSLALGGALAALAILSQTQLLLVILAGLFVVDTGSVIVQRAYFKITHGKRIFLMSPIHHHFELKGWAEVTIVVRFWIISGLCVAAGVGLFYFEWLSK